MSFPSVFGRGMIISAAFLPVGLTYGIGGLGSIVGCSQTHIVEPNNTPDVDEPEHPQPTASTQTDVGTSTDEFATTPDTLDLVNEARSVGRKCGDKFFSPAPPLTWSKELSAAALAHARDMADNDYYSHCGRVGDIKPTDAGRKECPPGTTKAWERAKEAGYASSFVGENIAIGQTTTQEVMSSWIKSPGHCRNIMNPEYNELGVAFAMGWNTGHGVTPDSPVGKAYGKTFLWAMSLGDGAGGSTKSSSGQAVPTNKEAYDKCAEKLFNGDQVKACQKFVDVCMAASDASAKVILYTDFEAVTAANRDACLASAIKLAFWGYESVED